MTRQSIRLLAAALVLLTQGVWAADFSLTPASRLWLEGDSTLHPYTSEAQGLEVDFNWAAKAPKSAAEGIREGVPVTLTVRVPVARLKSKHGGLDKNLRKALRADKFPHIVFVLSEYRAEKSSAATELSLQGELSVAGAKHPETIRATIHEQGAGLVIDGEQALLMTDFGVKPPTALLGTIKAANRVVVKFHLKLQPHQEVP